MSRNHPLPMKSREYDAFTPWRKVLCYMQRPGVAKKFKRSYNKRVRKAFKSEAIRESYETLAD